MDKPTVTYTSFSTSPRFTSFATTDATRQALISQIISDASCDLSFARLQSKWERAVYLMTAHMITIQDDLAAGQGGGSDYVFQGQITSLSTSHGSESASVKVLEANDSRGARNEWLRQTPYGAELALLLQNTLTSGYVV